MVSGAEERMRGKKWCEAVDEEDAGDGAKCEGDTECAREWGRERK